MMANLFNRIDIHDRNPEFCPPKLSHSMSFYSDHGHEANFFTKNARATEFQRMLAICNDLFGKISYTDKNPRWGRSWSQKYQLCFRDYDDMLLFKLAYDPASYP
jgi:hypothetical protein